MLTKEMLQQRLALLTQEKEQAVGAVNSYIGAINQLQWEMTQMEETILPEPPKAKRQAPKCKGRGCNKKAPAIEEHGVMQVEIPAQPEQTPQAQEEQANG